MVVMFIATRVATSGIDIVAVPQSLEMHSFVVPYGNAMNEVQATQIHPLTRKGYVRSPRHHW